VVRDPGPAQMHEQSDLAGFAGHAKTRRSSPTVG
jgi:hypothetical protein